MCIASPYQVRILFSLGCLRFRHFKDTEETLVGNNGHSGDGDCTLNSGGQSVGLLMILPDLRTNGVHFT